MITAKRRRQRGTTSITREPGAQTLAGGVAPASIELAPRFLRVGDRYAATLVVTGYPAEVGPAWLEPLLSWPGRLDLAMHIDPLPAPVAAARLRTQRARYESSRRSDEVKGKLSDPYVEAAADDAPQAGGQLYGVNPDSGGIVWWDRWAQENYNSVVLARSGAGKSYFVKLEVLRSLYQGVRVEVIDPEDEYLRLADAVGGTVVQLGTQGVKLNPLDLPVGDGRPDVLTRRGLFLHTLVSVLLGHVPPPAEKAALDRAILDVYRRGRVTPGPRPHTPPAPLLRAPAPTPARAEGPAAQGR